MYYNAVLVCALALWFPLQQHLVPLSTFQKGNDNDVLWTESLLYAPQESNTAGRTVTSASRSHSTAFPSKLPGGRYSRYV